MPLHNVTAGGYIRAGLSIPEALGKLSIGGPLPTYVED